MICYKINTTVLKRISLLFWVLLGAATLSAQMPNNWTGDSGIEIFRETVQVHSGNYSAGIIVNSNVQADCDLVNQTDIPVTPGQSFNVSLWGITSSNVYARVFFYWEGANSGFTPEYLAPGNEVWEEFTFQGIVPNGASSLKIGIRFYDVAGFTPGEIQYIDDLSFESPPGFPLSIVNGDFESWAIIKPEPSDYPTDFTGIQKSMSALLSWIDTAGDQLPDAYLIFAATDLSNTIPQDGIYYPDDFDLTDGQGTANVAFATGHFTFSNLESLSNYHFRIFPYTNSGININYKTDGIPPESFIQIPDVRVIEQQNFDISWKEWEAISIVGAQVWSRDNNYGILQTPCARISGKVGGTLFENEDWIISPAMDFTSFQNESLAFYTSVGYISQDEQFTVKVSNDYTGNGDPTSATWTNLSPVLPDGSVNWEWVHSGENDISAFESENTHIAFVYVCGTQEASTWQIDNILISGEVMPIPEPGNYPTDFLATVDSTNISLTWLDATGEIIPEAYLILGSDQDTISVPQDGTPIEDDDDFSDGTIVLNILPGIQTAAFAGLISGKTYCFKIFPYTNSGNQINYKTDGEPPSARAFISAPVDILFTDFNSNWGGWTPISVLGDQAWNRNNNSGLENTPCAAMNGHEGEAFVNEDWLISPAIELSETANTRLGFYNASQNSGQEMNLKFSVDYTETGNPNDFTWIDLSASVNWSSGEFSWIYSGDIFLTKYSGSTIYLAFIYFSDATRAASQGIDDVRISEIPVLDEPTNYPTNFAVDAAVKEITATWQDAVGEVEPWGYLLQVSDQDNLTLPENGIPIADDLDFSDGNGTVNLLPETESYTFVGLSDSTSYFASIIPYSNSDKFIKYKTAPAPPHDSATTTPPDGIWDFYNTTKLTIYPNPGNGFVYFEADETIQSVQVYTIDGKLIFDTKFSASTGHIELGNLKKGIYLAVFKINNTFTRKKHIIIQ